MASRRENWPEKGIFVMLEALPVRVPGPELLVNRIYAGCRSCNGSLDCSNRALCPARPERGSEVGWVLCAWLGGDAMKTAQCRKSRQLL